MNKKKQIRKELEKYLGGKLGKGDFILADEVVDFIKKDRKKQLTLTDVSQQRELLLADFIEKYNIGLVGNERIHKDCLKDYLQGNL